MEPTLKEILASYNAAAALAGCVHNPRSVVHRRANRAAGTAKRVFARVASGRAHRASWKSRGSTSPRASRASRSSPCAAATDNCARFTTSAGTTR